MQYIQPVGGDLLAEHDVDQEPARPEAAELPGVDGFEAFYRSEFEWARRLAFLLVSDAEAAEDIAQGAFIAMQRRHNRLENPRAYLRVAIVNASRKHRRSRVRQLPTADPTVTANGIEPFQLELVDSINRLSRRQRAVVVLRYFEDLSEREIARVLRCRPGTVKSLAARALKHLREELDHDLGS